MLFDHTIKGSVYVTSRVSCRMSILIRAGQAEPNAAWSVMSLVIHWQAITAGWMNGSYHHIINTDQCTCLSSNTISLSTQLSSVRCMSCLMSTNRKLKCLLWLVLPSWPVWPLRLFYNVQKFSTSQAFDLSGGEKGILHSGFQFVQVCPKTMFRCP